MKNVSRVARKVVPLLLVVLTLVALGGAAPVFAAGRVYAEAPMQVR